MALTGLDIYKKLAKTNCGDCGVPTCLAFAMKLAAGQAELSSCPHVSEDAIVELSEASAPPIRGVVVGTGDGAFKVGEETVLFRHDKTFVNPCAFAVMVEAGADDAEIDAKVKQAIEVQFERVQQILRAGAIAIKSSGDAARFKAVVDKVAGATDLPLILMTEDAEAAKAALEGVADRRPLLYGATEVNWEAMAGAAKDKGVPLGVKANGLVALSELTEKIAGAGVKDMVVDPGSETAGANLKDLVQIRRAALEKKFRPLGYPTIAFPADLATAAGGNGDGMLESVYAAMHVMKYGGIVVLNGAEPWKMLPLLVLRQNIYTDPQRPMQVDEKLYEINSPTDKSPLLVTTNFSLTYFIVSSEIEGSKVPTWLSIIDDEGLSVLTGWAAGKFTAEKIAPTLKKMAEGKVSHKEVVIPGFVATMSGELQDELGDGWKVVVGPREASDLPSFLKQYSVS